MRNDKATPRKANDQAIPLSDSETLLMAILTDV